MSLGQGFFQYPPPSETGDTEFGLFPVDFLLDAVLKAGLEWFRTEPKAPSEVFGHLRSKYLKGKYGEDKINEIGAFIKKYDIKIVQHFSLIDQSCPCISIQLLEGNEQTDRAGLSDFAGSIDVLDMENHVKGRSDIGYTAMTDAMHIGIHANNTPDLAKYIYYLVAYILSSFKPEFEAAGIQLGTFRASDISRLNEYLPENMYSRYINFTVFSMASFNKGAVPIIERIMGVNVAHGPAASVVGVDEHGNEVAACSDTVESVPLNNDTGMTLCSIKQNQEG